MRLGRTPRELLDTIDSAELGEILAYYALLEQEREEGKRPTLDVEEELRKRFGRPQP